MLVTLEIQRVNKSEKFEWISDQAIIYLFMKSIEGDRNIIEVTGFVTKGKEGQIKTGGRGLSLWANDNGRMINQKRRIYFGKTFGMLWKAAG